MIIEQIWLLKLIVSHLLTDFVLQPKSWIDDRNRNHFASTKLYLHGIVTAVVALIFIGVEYWMVASIILVSHTIIDGWKSYRREAIIYFIIDQLLHFIVIVACWYFLFVSKSALLNAYHSVALNNKFWMLITAVIFLTTPAGILIGQLTKGWREKISNPASLANAGKWIGIIERLIVFIFVMLGQYAAISLLIAAKGIIRFNEKDRPEVKTEYLVIGTLMSIGIALLVGQAVRKFM
ncbi:MAG TPA: DUF3307 domain-containing protein [Phototrophicaceae bacterium]|nr:DUF3307 domain-containing protein [Phototrophicaceae bacterium]